MIVPGKRPIATKHLITIAEIGQVLCKPSPKTQFHHPRAIVVDNEIDSDPGKLSKS